MFNIPKMRKFCLSDIDYFKQFGDVRDTKDGIQIFIDRGASVLGVAHLDTVCNPKGKFKFNGKRHQVFTPTLDDRLGVTILLDTLPSILGQNEFDVLLTEGEEIGCSTAAWFEPAKDYNWMFSFDRMGTDAVHYQFDSKEWLDALAGLRMPINAGMFSDLSFMDHMGCSGVNVGCAYYKYHSPNAFANLKETKSQIGKFTRFFLENKDKHFAHDYDAPAYGDYEFEFEDDNNVIEFSSWDAKELGWCIDCGAWSNVIRVVGGYDFCRECFFGSLNYKNEDLDEKDYIFEPVVDLYRKSSRKSKFVN
jgi:M42 glutamyl aminopeptidase